MSLAVPVLLEARRYDDPEVARLVAEVQQEYVVRYGGPDAAVVDAAEFDPPEGQFLVALVDGRAVASGGWRRMAPGGDVAELKRMYVAAAMRRHGVARLLLGALERSAAQAGVRRVVLNTGPQQPEAVRLYETSGYRPVPGFGVYAATPGALFYGKDLAAE